MFEYPGEYYELIRASFRDIAAEVRLIVELLEDGSSVLDAGCGTGTVIRELNGLGHSCTGVDQSASFIDFARRRSEQRTGIELCHASLVDFDTTLQFDLVLSMFGTINYLPYGSLPSVFAKMRRWVKPGGLLLVDIGHLLSFVDRFKPYMIAHHSSPDFLITRLIEHRVDSRAANWEHRETLLVRRGAELEMYHERYDEQILKVAELERMLHDAGFPNCEARAGFRERAHASGRDPIFVAS